MAQGFGVDESRRKDEFTVNFLYALNDAPFRFVHVKGKMLNKTDSVHLKSQIYQNKITLPGAKTARYVQDSTFYLEYFFDEYSSLEAASMAMKMLTTKISRSMNWKVLVLPYDWGTGGEIIKENKISYALHSGFYHYNMAVLVINVWARGTYRVSLQIYSGKPFYYNWIMKNEPIGGFNFINYVKKTFTFFDSKSTGCPTDIPAFTCKGKYQQNDSTYISYVKNDFDGLLNARTEFDVTFSNMRSSLGTSWVYYSVYYKYPCLRKIAFVKYEDVDKSKRKTLILSLNELPMNNPMTPVNRKAYTIDLSFTY